jgi:hypothetical protein
VLNWSLGRVNSPPEAIIFQPETIAVVANSFDEPDVFLNSVSMVVGSDPLRDCPLIIALLKVKVLALVL